MAAGAANPSTRWRTVLPICLERATLDRLDEALAPLEAVVTVPAGDWEEAAELSAGGRYDALVIGFPLQGGPLSRLLALVRRQECPCHDSAVVVVAPERHRLEARGFLGRGVNRVVGVEEMGLVLADVLEQLFTVAPRVGVRVPSRIEVAGSGFSRRVLCQTVNLSASGMLLRAPHPYRPGTELAFELMLPGAAGLIAGRGRVVREASERRESHGGIGVTFTRFSPANQDRLTAFLVRLVADRSAAATGRGLR